MTTQQSHQILNTKMNTLLVATNVTNSVGFGTAALGQQCHNVVLMALEAGFRYFDTAEENQYWYNSAAVASALREFHQRLLEPLLDDTIESTTRKTSADKIVDNDFLNDDECVMIVDDEENNSDGLPTCLMNRQRQLSPQQRFCYEIRVSTKIPPWDLISNDHIRNNAKRSRTELMSFCDVEVNPDVVNGDETATTSSNNNNYYTNQMPLDIYYIHAPACWKGWHTKCDNNPPHSTMDLRSVWLAMEAVVGIDHSARRIGLSNVRTDELLDIIHDVQERKATYRDTADGDTVMAPPRMPDVVQSFADPIAPAHEIRKICAQYDIEFVSYSTLGTQHIYQSSNPTRTNPVLTHPTVVQLSEQYQRSTAEIVLSWAVQHQMSIIPRSSQKVHIQELARLLPNRHGNAPVGFLTESDLARIDLMPE